MLRGMHSLFTSFLCISCNFQWLIHSLLLAFHTKLKIAASHWPFSVQFSTMATQNLIMIVYRWPIKISAWPAKPKALYIKLCFHILQAGGQKKEPMMHSPFFFADLPKQPTNLVGARHTFFQIWPPAPTIITRLKY